MPHTEPHEAATPPSEERRRAPVASRFPLTALVAVVVAAALTPPLVSFAVGLGGDTGHAQASSTVAATGTHTGGPAVDSPDSRTPLVRRVLAWNGAARDGYQLSRLRLFNKAIMFIKDNYLEPERVKPQDMFTEALEAVERQQAEVLVTVVKDAQGTPASVKVRVGAEEKTLDVVSIDNIWRTAYRLREAMAFIETNLPDAKTEDLENIEYAAINGALSTLDPHSVFLKPSFSSEMEVSTQGEFGGLGIQISVRDGFLTIIAPIPGTPAARLGLKPKDRIVTIGEESTVNMPIEEAVKRLRGPKGTNVTIGIMRDGFGEPKLYTITRDIIKVESVKSDRLEGDIGYIWLRQFIKDTAGDLRTQIEKFNTDKPLKGLVLDLRGNPGGLLEAAVEVSDLFLESGVIVSTVAHKNRDDRTAHKRGTLADLPVTVLVDAGSASASEIVAGALKYGGRGVIIGETTFGKGSVQVLYKFDDDPDRRTSLKLTIAQYLTPGDVSIQSQGIIPDIELVPIIVQKDAIELFHKPSRNKENDLKGRFDSAKGAKTDDSRPEARVQYLFEPPADEDEAVAAALEEKVKIDFPIKFAAAMLREHGANTRDQMLKTSLKGFLAREQADEDKLVADKLKSEGIDWQQGKDEGTPTFTTEFAIEDEALPLTFGDEVVLRLSVTNTGKARAYRVAATTESTYGYFERREFIFGKLEPGETRTAKVSIKLPPGLVTRTDELQFKFQESFGHAPATLNAAVTVAAQLSPSYVADIELIDKPVQGLSTSGNGDGKLDLDEKVALSMKLANDGPGPSPQAVSLLKNESSAKVFIEQGRWKTDDLAAGKSAKGDFVFSVRKGHIEPFVTLKLTTFDMKIGAFINEVIRPVIGQPFKARLSSPRITFSGAGPERLTNAAEVTIAGFAEDPDKVRDVYVTINNDKVFYKRSPLTDSKRLDFSAVVPLELGENVVTIVARKGEELAGVQNVIINRYKFGTPTTEAAAKVVAMDPKLVNERVAARAAKTAAKAEKADAKK
jgi:carboxyl-terminal processing protease